MTAVGALALALSVTSLALVWIAPVIPHRIASSPGVGLRTARSLLRRCLGRKSETADGRAIDVLQATHAAMRSGMPLVLALRVALERMDPARRAPFDDVLRAFEMNTDLGTCFAMARARTADRRSRLALDALALLATGELPAARGAALIGSVADRLAFEQRLADEVAARTGSVRAQIVILAFLVPALALYLVMTMPGLAATLGTPLGRFVLVPAALVFEIAGIVLSRAIVRGVLP